MPVLPLIIDASMVFRRKYDDRTPIVRYYMMSV